MSYKIKIDQPNLAEGADVAIHGLGTFANGGTYDVTDEQEEAFRAANAVDVGGVDDNPDSENFGAYIPNYQPGPSLADAVQNMYGVELVADKESMKTGMTTKSPVVSPSDTGTPADKGVES